MNNEKEEDIVVEGVEISGGKDGKPAVSSAAQAATSEQEIIVEAELIDGTAAAAAPKKKKNGLIRALEGVNNAINGLDKKCGVSNTFHKVNNGFVGSTKSASSSVKSKFPDITAKIQAGFDKINNGFDPRGSDYIGAGVTKKKTPPTASATAIPTDSMNACKLEQDPPMAIAENISSQKVHPSAPIACAEAQVVATIDDNGNKKV